MKAILVAGLGFGDEGKGTITQYLANEHRAALVVRYNGGAQAAHNVVLEDGRHHTFAQFGSATFEGVRTHLSRFMLVEPHALLSEGRGLVKHGIPDPYSLLTIDRRALLTTPYHWFANRVREIARDHDKYTTRHGSCGVGIGETMCDWLLFPKDAPTVGDLENPTELKRKLVRLQERKVQEFKDYILNMSFPEAGRRALKRIMDPVDDVVESYSGMTDILELVGDDFLKDVMKDSVAVFEGAQGVLLDQDYGFPPHNTWTDITFKNARELLKEVDFPGTVSRVGVIRSYMTRHGAGPLPTEDVLKENHRLDHHNGMGLWQGKLRVGEFDTALVKYSIDVLGGVDEIAMTHLDQVHEFETYATRYESAYGPENNPVLDDRGFLIPRIPYHEGYQSGLASTFLTQQILPVFTDHSDDPMEFIEEVASRLRTPITILSDGPCLKDKFRA